MKEKADHYRQGEIEAIDYQRDTLSHEEFRGYCRGQIMRYMHRLSHKHVDILEDLYKMRDYLDWLIEHEKGSVVTTQHTKALRRAIDDRVIPSPVMNGVVSSLNDLLQG